MLSRVGRENAMPWKNEQAVQLRELAPGSSEAEAAGRWERENASVSRAAVDAGWTGGVIPRARSLDYWVSNWGGYSKELTMPDGTSHLVSLEPWRGRDLASTFIDISYRWFDPSKAGTTRKPSRHS